MPTHALARFQSDRATASPAPFWEMVQIVHPDPPCHSANKHPNPQANYGFKHLLPIKIHSKKASTCLHRADFFDPTTSPATAGEDWAL